SMNLVEDRLVKLIKSLLDMEDDDEAGFVHNTKISLSLDFIEETRQELDRQRAAWDELVS
nr:hypothetical protein [Lachnospiraceae bacterium]